MSIPKTNICSWIIEFLNQFFRLKFIGFQRIVYKQNTGMAMCRFPSDSVISNAIGQTVSEAQADFTEGEPNGNGSGRWRFLPVCLYLFFDISAGRVIKR